MNARSDGAQHAVPHHVRAMLELVTVVDVEDGTDDRTGCVCQSDKVVSIWIRGPHTFHPPRRSRARQLSLQG